MGNRELGFFSFYFLSLFFSFFSSGECAKGKEKEKGKKKTGKGERGGRAKRNMTACQARRAFDFSLWDL